MGYSRFKAIKASYMVSGVVARVYGNTGKHKKTGLSLDQIQEIVQFIMNYAGVCRSVEQEGRDGCVCMSDGGGGMCVCVREMITLCVLAKQLAIQY